MFSGIRRVLGAISVSQTEREIVVKGIPAEVMTNDIARIWRTSRINKNLFTTASRNTLAFPHFFAPDVLYMLEQMTEHRSTRTNIRTLNKVKELLKTQTWLADTAHEPTLKADYDKLKLFTYTPLDYQQGFFEQYDRLTQMYRLRGYVLAAAAGSGKTYVGLALAEMFHADKIVLVVLKNSLYRVWEAEITGLYRGRHPSYWIYDQGKPYKGERIAMFHYESLAQALALVPELKGENTVVILDESHNLNEISSQRTQNFVKLCRDLDAQHVLWSSGTPVKSMGAELIPMLRTIDPYFTPEVETRFRAIYGRDGNRGLDILQHRMGLISYKVEKHQLGLKEPLVKELQVKMPSSNLYTLEAIRAAMADFIKERVKYYASRRKVDQEAWQSCIDHFETTLKSKSEQEAYKTYRRHIKTLLGTSDYQAYSEIIRWVNAYELNTILPRLTKDQKTTFKEVRSIIKYTPLKIQGEALGRVLGRKRIECHVDMVAAVDFKAICNSTIKKTVVFTSFVEALEEAERHLKAIGMSPLAVYGKTNRDLPNLIKRFEVEEDVNPLIATYHSLSTAVPLVMADTMIMLNAPFRAYIHEQAISRIHRLGSDTQVVIYEVRLDTGDTPNISTRSGDILAWSQNMVEAIMGIRSPYIIDETSNEDRDDMVPRDPYEVVATAFEDYGIQLTDPVVSQYVGIVGGQRPSYWHW